MSRRVLRRLLAATLLAIGLLASAALTTAPVSHAVPSQAGGCTNDEADTDKAAGSDCDGDGVTGGWDVCATAAGPVENSGCPTGRQKVPPHQCRQAVGAIRSVPFAVSDVLSDGFQIPIKCQRRYHSASGELIYPIPSKVSVTLKVSAKVSRVLGTKRTIVNDRGAKKGRTIKAQGEPYTIWTLKLPAALKSKMRRKGVAKMDGEFALTMTFAKEAAAGETKDPVSELPTKEDLEEGGDIPSFSWFGDSPNGCKRVTLEIIYGC